MDLEDDLEEPHAEALAPSPPAHRRPITCSYRRLGDVCSRARTSSAARSSPSELRSLLLKICEHTAVRQALQFQAWRSIQGSDKNVFGT